MNGEGLKWMDGLFVGCGVAIAVVVVIVTAIAFACVGISLWWLAAGVVTLLGLYGLYHGFSAVRSWRRRRKQYGF